MQNTRKRGLEKNLWNWPDSHHKLSFNPCEIAFLYSEIERLLSMGVIVKSEPEQGQFLSNVFLRPKKNGSFRLILNLRELNKNVTYRHFKMDTLDNCINLMSPNCFMASLDLRDAYYSVPIAPSRQKYLKFRLGDNLYNFTCLPNGLASAPRTFTKLLKPVFAKLRQSNHASSGYLDDSFLVGADELTTLKRLQNYWEGLVSLLTSRSPSYSYPPQSNI